VRALIGARAHGPKADQLADAWVQGYEMIDD